MLYVAGYKTLELQAHNQFTIIVPSAASKMFNEKKTFVTWDILDFVTFEINVESVAV